jgi:hypothetical protein
MQRLRVVQVSLHLIQLQLGVDAFAFGLLLLAECFLCLSARFEELRTQILDELEGVVELSSPMIERTRYNTAAAEEKVRFVVSGTGFKGSRYCFLITAKTKQFLAIFNAPACCRGNRDLKSRSFLFGMARPPVSFSFTRRASSNVNDPLQH